jgi:hypothetical protein
VKRVGIIAVAVVAAVAGIAWLLWPEPVPAPANGGPPPPERVNAVLAAPVVSRGGGGTISGLVTVDGGPVAGATVTATRAGDVALSELPCDHDGGPNALDVPCELQSEHVATLVSERSGEVVPVARTTSAADGTFTLEGLEPGTVAVWADEPRLGTAVTQHVEVGEDGVALELGGGVRITGSVVIEGTRPGAGAWVTLVHPEHSRVFDAIADADGRFSFGPLPDADYALVAGADGMVPVHVRLTSHLAGVVKLWAPRRITGVVEYQGTGLAGADLTLTRRPLLRTVTSGTGGAFAFERLRPGTYVLEGEAEEANASMVVEVPASGVAKPVRLVLQPLAVVVGHVRAQGVPVAGASVSVGAESEATDEGGAYRLVFWRGRWSIDVEAEGYSHVSKSVDLRAGEQTLDFDVAPAALVEGTVVDAETGAPVPFAHLRVGDGDVSTDGDGGFSLPGLAAGRYPILASHQGYLETAAELVAPSSGVRVRLDRGLELKGIVVDQRGQGVRAAVKTSRAGDSLRSGVETTDAGTFGLSGLIPGAYQLVAYERDDRRIGSMTVTLPAPSPVRIVLDPLMTISGVVVDAHGASVAGARVTGVSKPGAEYVRARADGEGRFNLKVPTKGSYELRAGKDEALDLDHRTLAQAGDTHVRLPYEASPRIRGRVVDGNHEPIPHFTVAQHRVEEPDGRFEVLVARSEVQVSVQAPGHVARQVPLAGERGDVTELGDVMLDDGRSVRVQVMAESGPVEGASVEVPSNRGIRTDADGVATLQGLGPSDRAIVVEAQGYAAQRVALGEADTEKVVTLARGASLVVSVHDSAGALVRASVTARARDGQGDNVSGWDWAGGVTRLDGLAPGRWFITASGQMRPGRAQTEVTVADHGEQALSLTLSTGSAHAVVQIAPGPAAWRLDAVALYPAGGAVDEQSGAPLGETYEGSRTATPQSFEFVNIPPGAYALFMVYRDGAHQAWTSAPMTVSDGAANEVSLPAPDPASLRAFSGP